MVILHHFQDQVRYYSKFLYIPLIFNAPVKGTPLEFCENICTKKLSEAEESFEYAYLIQ